MALKRFYETQEEIPEGLQEYYTERDGRWVLDAEAGEGEKTAEDVARALRARDNANTERNRVAKEFEELKNKFQEKGIKIEQLDEYLEQLEKTEQQKQELEHQKLIDEKRFEEAAEKKFERRIAEINHAMEATQKQMKEVQERHEALRQKYQKTRLADALSSEFLNQDTDPKKLPFLLAIAERQWELDEQDEPTPIDWVDGGRTKITAVGADGQTLTMKEHIKDLLAENTWAVLESKGSRSQHQAGPATTQNGVYIIPKNEASDIKRYERHKEAAEKAGLDWMIADA